MNIAYAAELPKLDRSVTISKEQFIAQSQLVQKTPFDDRHLAFKVSIPKIWQELNVKTNISQEGPSKQILGEITQYLGPVNLDSRSRFKVRANELPFEVAARDWFMNFMTIENFNLIGIEIVSEKRIQAHYVMLENGNQFVVRAAAEISGSRIILAEYIVPIEQWAAERDMAVWSMASFALTDPDPAPVEARGVYSFVDIASFNFPQSWILNAAPVTSLERLNASLINLKGGLSEKRASQSRHDVFLMDGRIDISLVAKGPNVSIASELQSIKDQLKEANLVLGDYIENVEGWPKKQAVTFAKIEVYKVNNAQNRLADYEEWIGVFESGGHYYLLRLLTVGRESDYLTWARNVTAFKIVTSTLSPS